MFYFPQVNKSWRAGMGSRGFHCIQMPALCTFLCSFTQQHLWLWWNLQLLGACEYHLPPLESLKCNALICKLTKYFLMSAWVIIIPSFSSSSLFMCETAVLTDALPAVWYGDADMGVFSTVRHQVICLLMATRSTSLFARTCITDKQGDYSQCAVFSMFHVIAHIFNDFLGPRASAAAVLCPVVDSTNMCFSVRLLLWLCCRCWCSTLYDVS